MCWADCTRQARTAATLYVGCEQKPLTSEGKATSVGISSHEGLCIFSMYQKFELLGDAPICNSQQCLSQEIISTYTLKTITLGRPLVEGHKFKRHQMIPPKNAAVYLALLAF